MPILDALEDFKSQRIVPFDVPGHKRGKGNKELAAFLEKPVFFHRCQFDEMSRQSLPSD